MQRQEVAAGSVDVPAPSDGGLPMASTPTSVPSATSVPAPSAPGPVSPPLDELARQLFGPLTARLKAELRLDRERAGLLTDLRQ